MSEIKTIGVLGAGQMGGGIAHVAALTGYEVLLADVDRARAEAGKAQVAKAMGRAVEKGKLDAGERDAALARIVPVDGTGDFRRADFAIEAATESIELKKKLFRAIDDSLPAGRILASNTSSISITLLAAVTSRPEQVVGMHFMNPVPVMKLVELIRGLATSDATYEATAAMATRMGKTLITSKDSPGFIVNRILIPLINEACFALQEGLGSAADIDTGAKLGLNHPMGPLELADLIGLDTCLAIADVLHSELGDDKYRPANNLRMHVAAGWLGRKTGRGFHEYGEGLNHVASWETLKIEDRGPIRIVRVHRPEVLNALDPTVVAELSRAFEAVGQDRSVRGVVLTGAGDKAFIAGADIAAMSGLDERQALEFASQGHGVGEMIANLAVPVIAAVGGFALGGGCEMALACDFIYASDRARFGQPEVKLGVIPGFGGTQRLLRRIGPARALEMCLTGEMIGADEALRLGLVNKVIPHETIEEEVDVAGVREKRTRVVATEPVVAAAVTTLNTIAAMGPLAIAKAKQVIHRGAELPLAAANQLEVEAFASLFGSADQVEGMQAFLAKRAPRFIGE